MTVPNIFWCYLGSLLENITEFKNENNEIDQNDIIKLIFMSIGFLIALIGLYKV